MMAILIALTLTGQVQSKDASAAEKITEGKFAGEHQATTDDLAEFVKNLVVNKIYPEDRIKGLVNRLEKLSLERLWLLNYYINYDQWDAAQIDKYLPRFEEASNAEVLVRIKVADERIATIRERSKLSEQSRQRQLQIALQEQQRQLSDRTWYERENFRRGF